MKKIHYPLRSYCRIICPPELTYHRYTIALFMDIELFVYMREVV
ncbi:hypothetical protein ACFLR2_00585 [Chlamydiota bacterium]